MTELYRRDFIKASVVGGAALLVNGRPSRLNGSAVAGESGQAVAFPIRPSKDRRYLVDDGERPFFYHADTAWNLPKKLTLAEAEIYFDDRKGRGFTAVQLQAVSKEQGPMTNRDGHAPFDPPDDILRPVEAYWKHLDDVLAAAGRRGLLVALAPLWIRWGGDDKEGWRNQLTEANARAYGRFLGDRYRHLDNLIWMLGGDANPGEKTRAIRELAAGLNEKAPHHLLTCHNAPDHSSAAHFLDDDWLDINLAYSYRELHLHVLPEYRDRRPVRPIVLGESGYEDEFFFDEVRGGTPHRIRRQAYRAILSGALGGHAFGQRRVWRVEPGWREALDSPATRQMAYVKELFASRAWFWLVPDSEDETLVGGHGVGDEDRAVAARGDDGRLVLAYLPSPREITVDLGRLASPATAWWFDPTDGKYTKVDGPPLTNEGHRTFAPPEKNTAGDGDFVLVLQARGPSSPRP